MKITKVEPFQVNWGGVGEGFGARGAMVRIETEDGIFGLGEASPMEGGQVPLFVIARHIAPFLIGKDVLDHEVLQDTLWHKLVKLGPDYSVTAALAAIAGEDANNVSATLLFADGSRAEIAYLTEGDPAYPKEVLEVYGEGAVARLHNFQRTELWRGGKSAVKKAFAIDKGQKAEMDAFVAAVKSGGAMPIAWPGK